MVTRLEQRLELAEIRIAGALQISLAHNGNLPDTTKLESFLNEKGVNLVKKNDSAMMMAAIGCYMDDGLDLVAAIKQAWPLFTGVFR